MIVCNLFVLILDLTLKTRQIAKVRIHIFEIYLNTTFFKLLENCTYLSWSPWSSCEGDCGTEDQKGIQFRERTPVNVLVGSHVCEPERENRSCPTGPCFGSCVLSSWSEWSPCSKSCNLGIQKRSRYYLSLQPNCSDPLEKVQDCNPQCCLSSS